MGFLYYAVKFRSNNKKQRAYDKKIGLNVEIPLKFVNELKEN